MVSVDSLLSLAHLEGAIGALLVIVGTSAVDYISQSLFDRKVFEPVWSWGKRKVKAWRTKRDKITADYEYSIYLDAELPAEGPRDAAADVLELVDDRSEGDFKILDQKWSADERELDVEVTYKGKTDPYQLTLNFIPDSSEMVEPDPGCNPSIGSIGVTVTFQFEFGRLRNSIIDLMLFARYLREAVTDVVSVRSVTDGRFIVSPIDNDLTLDEWIRKERFDVSLLLESEDSRSAVEFHRDKAVISSPHTAVDDDTVEYIRATLLNYYL